MFEKQLSLNMKYWNQLKIFVNRSEVQFIKRNHSQSFKTFYPKRIFSGIQPSGSVHIGNYFGAIKNWIEFQNNGEDVIWSIADMHALTLDQNPTMLRQNILRLTATLLACGIDPNKSILFQQSTVSMHAELSWIFACLTTMPRLAQQPQYKEKSKKLKNIPLGLYIYPILQTADILLYKATHVPVGEDQVQHVQLAEHLAQKFNSVYGDTFPMPIASINKNFGRIKSLRDPTQKMSKSENDIKSRLDLTDEPDILRNKIKKALTDFISEVTYEPVKRPGLANLLNIHCIITGESPKDICNQFENINTGQYKLILADIVIEKLNPIRKQIEQYMNEPDYLQTVLLEGTKKAQTVANKNWLEVRNKVGFAIGRLPIIANQKDKLHQILN